MFSLFQNFFPILWTLVEKQTHNKQIRKLQQKHLFAY